MASYQVQTDGGSYQVDTEDQPSIPEAMGHAAVNNLPLGGQLAAGTKSLMNDKGYSQNLEDWNKQTPIDKSAHPIAYGAGAVAGSLAPLAIPGVGEALEAAPIAGNATLGALNAVGNTDVTKHPGRAGIEAVGGAGLGGTVGGIMDKVAPFLSEKFASTATSPEAAKIATENPELLKNIPTTGELSERLPEIYKKMSDQIGEHMDVAKGSLSSSPYLNEGAISKDEIMGVVNSARKELGGMYTSGGKQAASALEDLAGDLTKTHNTVSQNQIYNIMQKVDDEIPWDKVHANPAEVTAEERAMVNVRRGLRNLLGEKNPEFGAMMEPVSILEKDRADLFSQFGLKRDVEGIRPGNQTAGKLENALVQTNKKDLPESRRILGNIKASSGEDLITPLRLQEFSGPTPASPMGIPSRIGAGAVGAGVGHGFGLAGMGLGAVAGERVLRQPMSIAGRNLASKTIQNLPGIRQGVTQEMLDFMESKFGNKEKR